MFLSADYDMAAYLEYTDQVQNSMNVDTGGDPASAVAKAAQSVFRQTAGRSRSEMSFTPEGLVVDGRVTFK